MVKVTKEMVEKAIAAIDWERVDAMTDADIERQIEENPDAAPDMCRERAVKAWSDEGSPVADRIRALREALGMSRPEFARAYGLPLRTLEGWEQGKRQPDPGTLGLLKLVAHMPERTREILERREEAA